MATTLEGSKPSNPPTKPTLRPALLFPLTDAEVVYAIVRDFAYPIDHKLHLDIPPNLHINDRSDDEDEEGEASSSMFDDDDDGINNDPSRTFGLQGQWSAQHGGHGAGSSHPNGGSSTIDRLPNYTFNSDSVPIDGSYDGYHFGPGQDPSHANGSAEPDDLQGGGGGGGDVFEDDGQRQPAVALYDFEQENDNELPLQEGQIIHICYPHGQGWLVAQELPSGRTGLVPENYVRLLEHVEGGAEALGLDEQMYMPDEAGGSSLNGASAGNDGDAAATAAAAGSVRRISLAGSASKRESTGPEARSAKGQDGGKPM